MDSYPWYITDWRESEAVAGMTLEERGLYRELLDICWREGSLPNDPKMLRRLSMCEIEEFERCWPNVSKMFPLKYGRLHNAKVDIKRPQVIEAKAARKRGAELTNAKRNAERAANRSAEHEDIGPLSATLTESPRAGAFPSLPSVTPTETTKPVVSVHPLPPQTKPAAGRGAALATLPGVTDAPVDAAQWKEYCDVFRDCGKALNEQDICKALRLWISISPDTRAAALADAKGRAASTWRTADLTAAPVNHLRDEPWTRIAMPRAMPSRAAPAATTFHERNKQIEDDMFVKLMKAHNGR